MIFTPHGFIDTKQDDYTDDANDNPQDPFFQPTPPLHILLYARQILHYSNGQ